MQETRGRALIVEDDDDLRVVLSILLTTEGWDVSEAASLEEAEHHLREMPELLVLDVQLGGHGAGELLAQLACRADAPVTLLASGCEELRGLARRYGVAYARKPVEIDAMMLAIDVALEQSRRPSLGHLRSTWNSVRPTAPSLA
jgi:DNA-binding response OmpR family regulator